MGAVTDDGRPGTVLARSILSPALAVSVLLTGNRICLGCGAAGPLIQVDHVRPRHAGGLSVPVNLACLCERCNMIKSCYWPGHGYHPFPAHDDAEQARMILWRELDWLAGRHGGHDAVAGELWGGAGEPGVWSWHQPAAGAWLAAWC